MDIVTLLLIVLLLVFLVGGVAWPRPAEGTAVLNLALYVLAFVVIVIVLLRIMAVL